MRSYPHRKESSGFDSPAAPEWTAGVESPLFLSKVLHNDLRIFDDLRYPAAMTPSEYMLREDPDQAQLFLMGPYDYGADQLRVNGYSFIGRPDEILVKLVATLVPSLLVATERLALEKPTIFYASHPAFPNRLAAFVGESSHDPMIVLMEQRLIQEILIDHRSAESALSFLERVMVHELAHAHVEAQLGDAGYIPEEQVLRFEERYARALAAKSLPRLHAALDAWTGYVKQFCK